MSDTAGDNAKYKWTPESTALLVSVWSDRQVQKQLEYAPRPQVIWENVARYMRKKGYNVSAKHCRSRMKQVLVCYREAKRAGTRSGVEQYYEIIDRVLKNKRLEHTNGIGVDTVDANMKSPPKDVKTNKNLQTRLKVQEPVQSLFRTDALSPTWTGRENEYPDSPESNETIIAGPYRVFSPTRDIAITTDEYLRICGNRMVETNRVAAMEEEPIREDYRPNLPPHYGEIPYQNTVQNVHNQIIQEYQNIQQNRGWNQLPRQNRASMHEHYFQENVNNHANQSRFPYGATLTSGNAMTTTTTTTQNPNAENMARQQNQLQQNALYADNRAMPQEPRKISFGCPNLTDRVYRQYRDTVPRLACMADVKRNVGSLSPDYSPDTSQNLNNAFCQSKSDEKTHNLNETYPQPSHLNNNIAPDAGDMTVVTNNATCNDDSLLQEFLLDSPTPSENENGKLSRDSAVNTDNVPSAPFRKKKAQKLEQLVLSAISSQNEVVNKILAAQNDMVARFLDVDRDRQNRLENRLDHLLNVVHATVLNKNSDTEREASSSPEPAITSLHPPPKPGMVPPKLDLVPPKPCRVPCTMPSSNVELINQNPVLTRPGIVSPINSPDKRKPGAIWFKLGPVSQSPFVKAQQRLGLQLASANNDARTQSSAERRIAKELDRPIMNARSLMYETAKLLERERQLEEMIENARLELAMGQTLTARRKLFTQREPTPIMILTAAFLDAECRACELDPPYHGTWNSRKLTYARRDNLLAGQGESYERMRHLNAARHDYLISEPCDSSTPAKLLPSYNPNNNNNNNNADEAVGNPQKQSIQQLARLLMNSARWRDPALHNQQHNSVRPPGTTVQPAKQDAPDVEYNATFTAPKANAPPLVPEEQPRELAKDYADAAQQKRGNEAASSDVGPMLRDDPRGRVEKFPMGFTTAMLIANEQKGVAAPRQTSAVGAAARSLGFAGDNPLTDRKNNVRFLDEALAELQRMYVERQIDAETVGRVLPVVTTGNGGNNGALNVHGRNMIERYVSELTMPRKPTSRDTDSDNDDEFLDTTASMHPTCVIRRGSLTSNGTASTETAQSTRAGKAAANHCIIG